MQQLSPKYLSIIFYFAFHHLLPTFTISVVIIQKIALISMYTIFAQADCIICKQKRCIVSRGD